MNGTKAIESLKALVESCLAQKSPVDSDSLVIPAEAILKAHPEAAASLVGYFRKVPDSHELKEFLGSLIVYHDKTPHRDVFDYVSRLDPQILKDVHSDDGLLHYRQAFFK